MGARFSTYGIKVEARKREEVGLAGEYMGGAGRVVEHGVLLKIHICRKIIFEENSIM